MSQFNPSLPEMQRREVSPFGISEQFITKGNIHDEVKD